MKLITLTALLSAGFALVAVAAPIPDVVALEGRGGCPRFACERGDEISEVA